MNYIIRFLLVYYGISKCYVNWKGGSMMFVKKLRYLSATSLTETDDDMIFLRSDFNFITIPANGKTPKLAPNLV